MITTFAEGREVQPTELVTVKLYVPAAREDKVELAVDPAMLPGFMVQLPEGKPLKTTVPVATAQVGCVIVPTVGADGVTG